MERKTCTLTVESEGRTGYLYISQGELVDARIGEQPGDDAVAMRIIGWADASVTIINTCVIKKRTVKQPTGFIIMEAVRLADEARRQPATHVAAVSSAGDDTIELGAFDPWSAPPPPAALSAFPPPQPADAEVLAVLELQTGRVCSVSGKFAGLEALAQLVATIYAHESATVEQLAIGECIQELVISAGSYWLMAKPFAVNPYGIALLVFDARRTNVVIARSELEGFVQAFDAWSARSR
jgi:hypothetical protein